MKQLKLGVDFENGDCLGAGATGGVSVVINADSLLSG